MTTEFQVPDASCGHCKSTIESAISSLRGVTSARLDLGSKRVQVEHEATVSEDQLIAVVRSAGYTPQPVA